MIGRLLVGFVWLNLQISVSWLVDFQWGSCGSIFSFLCLWQVDIQGGSCGSIFCFLRHGWQTCSGVREAQSLVFCVKVGNLQWGSCGSIFSFLCHGWQTFSGVRVTQSLVFCVMVRILLVGFVCLNLQFSVSWLGDFQWGSCGSNFSFLSHGRQTFSGVRVAQSLLFCLMVGRILVGFVWLNLLFSVSWLVDFQWASCVSIFSFLCHGWQTFSGLRVSQYLDFCVMVGILLVGFVWLNLLFSVSWLVDFQWGSCGSIFSFLFHGRQTFSGVRVTQSLVFCVMVGRLLVGFVWLNLQFSVAWLVDFQWGSCVSIFSFLCHGRQTFSGVRVALQTFNGVRVSQSLVFCVMVGRLLVEFVWLYLQFSVLWQVDFQWGSCGSIFRFLRHVRQTFSGFRVSQSLVFCVMVDRLLVGFVWLNLQFSVSRQVDFNGVRVSQSLVFCVMVGRLLVGFVLLNLQFCVMVGRFIVGFVWLNLLFSVSWLVDFQWGSCGGIVSFLCHGRQIFSGVRVAQSSFLCHGWQTFRGVRVAQSLGFCVMVGRPLAGLVWLNLQFYVSWLIDFQWGSCGSIFCFLSHGRQTFSGFRVAQSLVLCHGRQTFSGVRVAQSLVFCVMVGRFQWAWCGSIFNFLCHGRQTFSGVRVALQTFNGVCVSQSLVFCVMVGRLLVEFVWLYLQFSVSWLVDFQWGSCGSMFRFLCHVRQTFSGIRVSQSLVFCVMVGRHLVGFVWLNLYYSVS